MVSLKWYNRMPVLEKNWQLWQCVGAKCHCFTVSAFTHCPSHQSACTDNNYLRQNIYWDDTKFTWTKIRHTSQKKKQIKCAGLASSPLICWHDCLCAPNRITEWTFSWDSSGMTLGWPTANIPMTPLTLIPPCWTPFGNPICSLPMKREPISTRLLLTTSFWGSPKTGMFCTV